MEIEQASVKSDYIMYLCNAGVMIKIKDKRILIDAFCCSEIPAYKSTPDYILDSMIHRNHPFEDVDMILITHHHSDHFDVESLCSFLIHNTTAVVVSTPTVISILKEAGNAISEERLIELDIPKGSFERITLAGIEIQAISMLHDGKEYEEVYNYAYLVQYLGISVLHLGDASPVAKNFEYLELKQQEINLLIANFPYLGVPTARKIIKDIIKPSKVVILHLPHEAMDRFGWIKAAKKNYESIKENFMPVVFLEKTGDTVEI